MTTYNLEMFVLYTFFGIKPIDKILRRWRIRLDLITQKQLQHASSMLKKLKNDLNKKTEEKMIEECPAGITFTVQ